MTEYVFAPPSQPAVKVAGESRLFPVRRIFCVGRNYADHAREMGADPTRELPFFFCKPADAIVADGSTIPYPLETKDLQHEIELVAAIGEGGSNIAREDALAHVFGYGVGIDLTRRDLQQDAKDKRRPWDWGKGFDQSAPISALHKVSEVGHPAAYDVGQLGPGPHCERHSEAGRRPLPADLAGGRRHCLHLPVHAAPGR